MPPILPPLYAVADEVTAARIGWSVADLARALLDGGARLVQVRAGPAGSGQLLAWCDEIVAAARPRRAAVIVNDRADIASLAGAAGVHLGQTDVAPAAARRLLPAGAMVGLSTHSRAEVDAAARDALAYVAVGPVYATSTKITGRAPVGLELVRYAARAQPLPVVAIGGITLERAPAVLEAGAAAVAVVSDLLRGGDPARRTADYCALLARPPK